MTVLRWLHLLEDLLFPSQALCPLCREHQLGELECCSSCLAQLGPLWKMTTLSGKLTASLFTYQGYGRQVIQQMKFHGGYRGAVAVGALLGRALRESPEFSQVDLLVPVPLHPSRKERRGYNQAEALVHGILSRWRRPVFTGVLRVRDTPAQSGLSLEQRKANLQQAFALAGAADLSGKVCLVIDDVLTSGSTFRVVAHVLEKHGAACLGAFAAQALLENTKKQT